MHFFHRTQQDKIIKRSCCDICGGLQADWFKGARLMP